MVRLPHHRHGACVQKEVSMDQHYSAGLPLLGCARPAATCHRMPPDADCCVHTDHTPTPRVAVICACAAAAIRAAPTTTCCSLAHTHCVTQILVCAHALRSAPALAGSGPTVSAAVASPSSLCTLQLVDWAGGGKVGGELPEPVVLAWEPGGRAVALAYPTQVCAGMCVCVLGACSGICV